MDIDLQTNLTLIALFFALAIGLSVFLVTWLFSRALAEVPEEDREYKDPPPWGFRLIWLPIQWTSFYLRPLLPKKIQNPLAARLKKAGLDYSIDPAQFIASRLICAACTAGLSWWVLGSFDPANPVIDKPGFSLALYLQIALGCSLIGFLYPALWLRDRLTKRKKEVLRSLPFFLDIITLCVEAGLNLQGAMNQAVTKGPEGVLRSEFQRVLRDIRAGKGRADSLRDLADRMKEPCITNFVSTIVQAESMGMNLGPILRTQADQRRNERFIRAEKLAMEAPVKMLFPLIACIFPCTFIVLLFPIVMKFLQSGL